MPLPKLKRLARQTVVLVGASSGIGLSTARMAARRGANLVLAARNGEALEKIAAELRGTGARVAWIAADVADPEQVEAIARLAEDRFGGFDSWCNIAGVFAIGRMEDTPIEDQRRLFDVLYWGAVHGTLTAAKRLKQTGGAIVNIGSILSDRAIALQGTYCAAKFAVKGATDAFRMEFAGRGYPISVTLVKPAAIDTPFSEHVKNLTGEPGNRVPPPVYHPRLVARAILHACEHPVRDLTVGGGGAVMSTLGNLFPGLTHLAMAAFAKPMQTSNDPGDPARRDNVNEPEEDGAERSSLGLPVRRTSLLLEAQMNPVATAAAALMGAAAAAALALRRPPEPAWKRAARKMANLR